MGRALDLTGKRFGRLLVQELTGSDRQGRMWRCACDCGDVADVRGASLTRGKTGSCGCLGREASQRVGLANRRHGMTNSPEYICWLAMRARCGDPKHISFRLYGARGIKVCARWAGSFDDFYADMGARPSLQHSLDRWPDKSGDYEPGNCRWATDAEQSRNSDLAEFIVIDGRSQCITDWLREFGVNEKTYYSRMRLGWDRMDALTLPADLHRARPKRQPRTYEVRA